MEQEGKNMVQFLMEEDLYHPNIDIDFLMDEFIDDLEQGLCGNIKSLLAIPTYMEVKDSFPVNKSIIVMDAGGTNFRIALVTFDNGRRPIIEELKKYPMPGSEGTISKTFFLNTIIHYMQPYLEKSDEVGFCFSFPTEILPNLDGRLLGFNKEIRVSGSEGMIVGEALNAILRARKESEKHFVLLNDTVATLFSGIADGHEKKYSGYIGLILGTGTNTCYIESCSNITKIKSPAKKMTINLESGGWNGVKQCALDKILDDATDNPGDHIFEKMVSGAYLGDLILLAVQKAANQGCFSESFKACISELKHLSMETINAFCSYSYEEFALSNAVKGSRADWQALLILIDSLLSRAAKLVAINICSIIKKTGTKSEKEHPVCVIAEGSFIQYFQLFKEKLIEHLEKIEESHSVFVELVHIDNATIVGTAIAGLMNAN